MVRVGVELNQRLTGSPRRRALVLLAICSACVVLVAVLYLGAVRTRTGQRADEAGMVGRTTNARVQTAAADVLDTISVGSFVVVGSTLGILALARRRPRLAVGIGIMILAANVSTQLLKSTFLSRPDLLHRSEVAASSPSFPSGHATVAMSLGLAFLLVVPPRLRRLAGVTGVAYAVVIGAGTLTRQWHRPSDVIGGFLVAAAWAAALAAWLVAFRGTGDPEAALRPAMLSELLSGKRLVGGGVILVLSASLISALVLLVFDGRALSTVELGPSYFAAVAAIIGTGCVILGAVLSALRGALLDPPDHDMGGDHRQREFS